MLLLLNFANSFYTITKELGSDKQHPIQITQRGECCSKTYPTVLPAVCHYPLRPLFPLPYRTYFQPEPPVRYPMSRFLSELTCMEKKQYKNKKNNFTFTQLHTTIAMFHESLLALFLCHFLWAEKSVWKMAEGRTWCKVCSPFGQVMNSDYIALCLASCNIWVTDGSSGKVGQVPPCTGKMWCNVSNTHYFLFIWSLHSFLCSF